jgi:hypothetical protein
VSITSPRIRFGAANPVPKLLGVIAGMCAGGEAATQANLRTLADRLPEGAA